MDRTAELTSRVIVTIDYRAAHHASSKMYRVADWSENRMVQLVILSSRPYHPVTVTTFTPCTCSQSHLGYSYSRPVRYGTRSHSEYAAGSSLDAF